MANDLKEIKGETELDIMDELLDEADDFDELTETEDKRRRKAGEVRNGKARLPGLKSEAARELRRESRNNILRDKVARDSKRRIKNMDGTIKKENEAEFDTRSEASSDHDDEPSMSEGSKNSSVSRDSSVERDLDEIDLKRKRSASESSMKSPEREMPMQAEKDVDATPPKKKYDYMTKINYMFRETRFFLMKSNNLDNIEIAMSKGVWSTPPQNESKLNQAFRESRNVILIYSVKESGKFCGFCRLSSESRRDLPMVDWVLPPTLPARALVGIFQIDWISRKDLSFVKTQHLYNPWNEGKPVKIGKDGQEIEPRVAEELCRLIPKDDSINLTPILHKSKKSAKERRIRGPLRRPMMIPGDRRGGGRGGPFRERGGGRGMRIDHFGGRGMAIRRRHYEEDFAPRVKRMRGLPPPRGRGGGGGGPEKPAVYPRERVRERSPNYRSQRRENGAGTSSGGGGGSSSSYAGNGNHKFSTHFKSYQDFMRDMRDYQSRPHHSGIPPMAFPPPPPFDPLSPPRYYDGPPMLEYPPPSRSRTEKRTSSSSDPYDRSVDEFLLRTRERSRDHSRERRYRERR